MTQGPWLFWERVKVDRPQRYVTLRASPLVGWFTWLWHHANFDFGFGPEARVCLNIETVGPTLTVRVIYGWKRHILRIMETQHIHRYYRDQLYYRKQMTLILSACKLLPDSVMFMFISVVKLRFWVLGCSNGALCIRCMPSSALNETTVIAMPSSALNGSTSRLLCNVGSIHNNTSMNIAGRL